MGQRRIPSEQRKSMITRSAITVFSRSNYKTAKVRDIAKLSGVTEPMVYRYFKTKKNLYLNVLNMLGKASIERMLSVPNESGNSITYLKEITWKYLNSIKKYKQETKVFYQAISEIDDEDIKKVLQDVYKSYVDMYIALLDIGKERGQIQENVNNELWAWNMLGIFIHLSSYYLLDLYKAEHVEQIVEQQFILLVNP